MAEGSHVKFQKMLISLYICTKFGTKMHHGRREMTTSPKTVIGR